MTALHTPGPWKLLYLDPRYAVEKARIDGAGCTVAYLAADGMGRPEGSAQADFRLMCAAPELLAACEGIVAVFMANERPAFDDFADAVRACLLAAAKAKGGAA